MIPYYERFLQRFPTIEALAEAPEPDLLAAWSGLGYYHRARNLQKAAREMDGQFPRNYGEILSLPGVGEYTAAAVASIAFDLPNAVVDGNVLRVLSRLTCDPTDLSLASAKAHFQQIADHLLDRHQPGVYNQAIMELGATLCLPEDPHCILCPVREHCQAQCAGRHRDLPVKSKKKQMVRHDRTLLIVRRDSDILFWQRPPEARHLGGFWELPEPKHLPEVATSGDLASFRHTIMNRSYRFSIRSASVDGTPEGMRWLTALDRLTLPVSTTARKALALVG